MENSLWELGKKYQEQMNKYNFSETMNLGKAGELALKFEKENEDLKKSITMSGVTDLMMSQYDRMIPSALENITSQFTRLSKDIQEAFQMEKVIPDVIKEFQLFRKFAESIHPLEKVYMSGVLQSLTREQGIIRALQEELKSVPMLDETEIKSLFAAMSEQNQISETEINEDYLSEEISEEDVAAEVRNIIKNREFTLSEKWDEVKKSRWFKAIKVILFIISFMITPIADRMKDDFLEVTGINQYYDNIGVLDFIDKLFGLDDESSVLTEEEAKENVDSEKTGNISKKKREELLEKIQKIRTYISSAEQDENTSELLSYLSDLAKDVNGKKYGLVFEEHREEIDEVLDTHTPVLTEDTDLLIDNGGQVNFLIEGDNLASLKLLEKTHKGKIDLIYIDPPYNTGNEDFIYDDCYIDSEDGFRHSKWVSFMSKRLEIARTLLTETGVIFIQISDIELSTLRLMCDKIFGEDNFLNIISINMKNIAGASGGGEDKRFKKNCEYILVYAKNYPLMPLFNGPYEYREIYSVVEQYRAEGKNWHYTSVLVDCGDKEYIGSTVDGSGDEIKLFRRKNAVVKSIRQIMVEEAISEKEVYYKYGNLIFEAKDAQSSIRTRVINAKKQFNINDDIVSIEYIPRTGKNKGKLYEQFYKGKKCRLFAWLGDISENIDGALYKKDLQGTYWDYTSKINNLTKEGNVEFSNGKKPVDLLKRIISIYPSNDITVCDFFAGSGSTGHAVISQNIDDGGNRQFILCTNDQNNICREKTYVRLSNVINGYTTEKGKVFAPMPASLKYYKVEYIPISDRMYYEYADELLLHIRELVELENGINFTGNAEIAIVLTDDELSEFVDGIADETVCRKLYMGHDILPEEEQEEILRSHNIEVAIIPDYYYRNLQEK